MQKRDYLNIQFITKTEGRKNLTTVEQVIVNGETTLNSVVKNLDDSQFYKYVIDYYNKLGEQGWELADHKGISFFKRPKQE